MRAQEFVREDGFTPAQQAAQRAGMGTKAWVNGPPAKSNSSGTKSSILLQAAQDIWNGYIEITQLSPTLSREEKKRAITRIVSKLAANFGLSVVGGVLGGILAGAVSGPGMIPAFIGGTIGGALLQTAGEDSVEELAEYIVHVLYDQRQPANQRPAGPETGKHPWEHPSINEESASDINPDTGRPWTHDEVRKLQNSVNPATGKKWTPDEWRMYWDYGTNRPYTEKEKEMFGKPEDGPKNLGRFILSRTPVIGDIMAIGDAIKGFKDLSR